jgi:ethanolamine ammonia-lyase small subunit
MTINKDPWEFLRQFTHARIALGRAGHAAPTQELLNFRLAHSKARDSVWSEVEFKSLRINLERLSLTVFEVQSLCETKQQFLLNPDLGRRLAPSSSLKLSADKSDPYDCALIIGDGLSANAVHENAWEFSREFIKLAHASGFSIAPVVLAKYARVGLADPIGEALNVKSTIMLIGERPGLASSDSLSVYFTYGPRTGNSDAHRNCISNIHASGLTPIGAAMMSNFLVQSSFQRKLSGVDLKVEYPALIKS